LDLYRANHDRIFRKATEKDEAELRETLHEKFGEAATRCDKTVDIEVLIRGSKDAEGDG
jgi:hypothetical protein